MMRRLSPTDSKNRKGSCGGNDKTLIPKIEERDFDAMLYREALKGEAALKEFLNKYS